ncbi:unnamed protein product [Phaeothamnion confervicola]
MQGITADIEDAFYGVFANFPNAPLALAMRAVAFPTGRCYPRPSDKLAKEVAQLVSTDSAVHELFKENVFISTDLQDRVALIHATVGKAVQADKILAQVRKEKRQPTASEQALIDEVEAAREVIIQVDSFRGLGKEALGSPDWDQETRPALADIYGIQGSGSDGEGAKRVAA